MTKEQFVSDVILQVLQSAPSDDTEIEKDQIAFWGSYHLEALQRQEIDTELKNARMIPPVYLERESCKPMSIESSDCGTGCQDRFYFTVAKPVLDLANDRGVAQVITDQGDIVYKASVESLNMFKRMRFAKPSSSNLLYTRQGQTFYVEGIREEDIEFSEITIDYVPKQDIMSLSDTDELKVSSLLAPTLIDLVVQRLKLQMYGSTPDVANDGVDLKNIQYHTAIKSGVEEPNPEQ
jgi:hypothetical protein